MDIKQEALKKHYEWQGKIEITPRAHVTNSEELSLAYTPGVAEPCLAIRDDYEKSYLLTRRANMVAVITDGSAILGLGDIGPEAGMPVMEGKCVLFKAFGGVDAIPLCIRSQEVEEIVNTVALLAGSFGGVNLEDISAPRCFEIEQKLRLWYVNSKRFSERIIISKCSCIAAVILVGILRCMKIRSGLTL